ncbi:MAG: 5'-nucleotidase, lipoprotein e(P4) family [Bacteriovoracaceae bacterium]|nr:5'-nucleotidase, lipoprotein e(P4) family [Bacteriovoracaceae bacterium]
MKKIILGLVIGFMAISCNSKQGPTQDQLLHATVWYQQSAEFRALSYQAFNVAKMRIDMDLMMNRGAGKKAIIVDVDETIVDNSPYQASGILNNRVFSNESWREWVDMAQAKALPGSVEFLNYAHSKGYTVFYISNRKQKGELLPTLKNLKALGFPVVKENMMFKTTTSSKIDRRKMVTDKGHRIALLMGDAMGDFKEGYKKKNNSEQMAQADADKERFGADFIVLPNPMYGKWETATYKFNYKLSEKEKVDARKAHLLPIKK